MRNNSDIKSTFLSLLNVFEHFFGSTGIRKYSGILLSVASIFSVLATYIAFTRSNPFGGGGSEKIIWLINLDLGLLLTISVIIAQNAIKVWAERKQDLAGARLHIKLVSVFAVLAIVPAIIMAVFSALFFNFGIQSWFNDRVRTALNESVAVAEGYLKEHQKVIRGEVEAMAYDLHDLSTKEILPISRDYLDDVLNQQANARALTEAIVFDENQNIIGKSLLTFALELEWINNADLERARRGEVVILQSESLDHIRALAYIAEPLNAYLYVGRLMDSTVLGHVYKTQTATDDYNVLENQRSHLQITFALIFIVVALLLLLLAIWIGMVFSSNLAKSISTLIITAEKVRSGDLTARVNEQQVGKELNLLSKAFNRMTRQLQEQQDHLISANSLLDRRRHFIESILTGVSVGIVAIDHFFHISHCNRSFCELLEVQREEIIGQALTDLIPELTAFFKNLKVQDNCFQETYILLIRQGVTKNIYVRAVAEKNTAKDAGFIITLDNITDLISAQRKAAWADVARRIAHEIKNPLTPIQLSAERIKKKYLSQIHMDPETFQECTDTIIRQVSDIGRMVDEFSHFARMPAPVFREENLNMLCQQSVFLHRTAHSNIEFKIVLPEEDIYKICDGQLIRQALNNLIQNSIDSIHSAPQTPLEKKFILITLLLNQDKIILNVEDNGKGLPKENRASLTEPYVTTRTKGTGLGLAIVKKIMEDHQGILVLEDRTGGGANVQLVFYKDK